jgi:RNAse (barnase) inhibitor barstar
MSNALTQRLAQPDEAGVFELPGSQGAKIIAAAAANGFRCYRVNLAGAEEQEQVLQRFADALHFPGWFGHNQDALADCLTDMSWAEASGYVLLVENSADYRAAAPEDFDALIAILSDASASWSGLGVPFWGFVLL